MPREGAARHRARGQARAAVGTGAGRQAVLVGIVGVVGIFPDLSEGPFVRFPASSAFSPDWSARGPASEDADVGREGSRSGRGERAAPCCVS